MSSQPFVGIDFGTCNSSMAWFNPKTGQPEVLLNAEGEDKTPSVVWFGPKEVLVGKYAEERLESPEDRKRMITAAKRELAKPRIWMVGDRAVTPVDAAAEVLRKLKRDAEVLHFYKPVAQAVITHPADFDEVEKDKLREAAARVGFQEVEMLEEPVAAAIAYAAAGVEVGRHVLVYDLGGGTFDLALLVRDEDEGIFRLAMEPRGRRFGGEDFDRAIYDYFDGQTRTKFGKPLCADGRDLLFLCRCRKYKENLSLVENPMPLSWLISGLGRLKMKIKRKMFEELIAQCVERTVHLTQLICEDAIRQGQRTDSLILIGGSTRVPLIQHRLHEALQVEPRRWQKQDIAVALGAAYHANQKWGEKRRGGQKAPPPSPPINGVSDQYRRAVKWVWRDQVIGRRDLEQLLLLAQQLCLSREEAGAVELEIMGGFKEVVFDRETEAKAEQKAFHEKQREQYRNKLQDTLIHAKRYHNGKPFPSYIALLREKGSKWGLSFEEAKEIEREVLDGLTIDEISDSQTEATPQVISPPSQAEIAPWKPLPLPPAAHVTPPKLEVNEPMAVHPWKAFLICMVIVVIVGIVFFPALVVVKPALIIWYWINWMNWRKQRR
jgi:actin-like ATPase involved in cell morphogenesis